MEFILGVAVGAIVVAFLAWRRRSAPNAVAPGALAAEVRSFAPEFAGVVGAKPAVLPEDVPGFIDHGTVNAPDSEQQLARRVKDPDARDFLLALKGWTPRHHAAEVSFGNSLQAFVRGRFGPENFERWPVDIRLQMDGDEGKVLPDFCFRRRLLVEIKGDIHTASEVDRTLGQLVRYLLAWKRTGPALLIVCGDCRPVYRALVHLYVRLWRELLRIPVTAYFIQDDVPDDRLIPSSRMVSSWNERDLSRTGAPQK